MLRLDDPQDVRKIRERLRRLSATGVSLPPAVVAGTSINALGVVRSLGPENIPVIWLTSNAHSFVNHSRYASCTIVCKDVFYDGFVPALRELGPLFKVRPVLFLTHDFQVERLSENREALRDYYRFDLPAKPIVSKLLTKDGFYELALHNHLTVPSTAVCRNGSDLLDFLRGTSDRGPWVVKPFQKSDSFEATFGKAVKIRIDKDWDSFIEAYRNVTVPIMVQSWIEGPDSNVAFCLVSFDSEGRSVGSFVGRKIRQFVPEVGNTASAEKFVNGEVEKKTFQFFSEHHFVGMGSMEFKYDDARHQWFAIEPTVGRTNLQSEVATINGCNLPAIYYHGLVGNTERQKALADAARRSTVNRVWIRFGADMTSSWYYFRQGSLSLKDWLRPYAKRKAFAVFRTGDPLPTLSFLRGWFLHMFFTLIKSVLPIRIKNLISSRSEDSRKLPG